MSDSPVTESVTVTADVEDTAPVTVEEMVASSATHVVVAEAAGDVEAAVAAEAVAAAAAELPVGHVTHETPEGTILMDATTAAQMMVGGTAAADEAASFAAGLSNQGIVVSGGGGIQMAADALDEQQKMEVMMQPNVKMEFIDPVSSFADLSMEMDPPVMLDAIGSRLFNHFSIFDLMMHKARHVIKIGAMDTLVKETELVLGELRELMDRCLEPVPRVCQGKKRGRPRGSPDPSVEIGLMLSHALGIDKGRYRKKVDYDNYSGFDPFFGKTKHQVKVDPDYVAIDEYEEEEEKDAGAIDDSHDDPDYVTIKRERRDPDDDDGDLESGTRKKKYERRKPYKCRQCGKRFKNTQLINAHIKKCRIPKTTVEFRIEEREDDHFYCMSDNCNKRNHAFGSYEEAENHFLIFHCTDADRVIPCVFCEEKFVTVDQRNRHLRQEHRKVYPCKLCNRAFAMKKNLLRHLKVNHGQTMPEVDDAEKEHSSHLCLKCGRRMNSKQYLDRHEAKCNGIFVRLPKFKKVGGEFFCTVDGCNLSQGFSTQYGLRQHFDTVHLRDEEKLYSCDYCDAKFSHNTARNKHVKLHLKLYQCDFCGKRFGAKDKLKSHHLTHTGEKPWGCDKCDYRAAKKYNLDSHKQVKHSDFGDRNFYCELCGKPFVTPGRVRMHIRSVHQDGKNVEGKKRSTRKPPGMPIPTSAAAGGTIVAAGGGTTTHVVQQAGTTTHVMQQAVPVSAQQQQQQQQQQTIQQVQHIVHQPQQQVQQVVQQVQHNPHQEQESAIAFLKQELEHPDQATEVICIQPMM